MREVIPSFLVCPRCKKRLEPVDTEAGTPQPWANLWSCSGACGAGPFPIVEDRPILIDDENSLFKRFQYAIAVGPDSQRREPPREDWLTRIARRLPDPVRNISPPENYAWVIEGLAAREPSRLLVLGCGEEGANMKPLYDAISRSSAIELVEIDVAWNSRAGIIADGHDLPLADGSIGAVVCQAVLEHVLDSERVVEEIFRVLRPGGRLLAEIPFMQSTHGFPYDFRRFTMAGQRVLFRGFDCASIGVAVGTGSAAASMLRDFLLSVVPQRERFRVPMRALAAAASSWWKYFDRLRARTPAARVAPSGIYFLGVRRHWPLTRKEAFLNFVELERSGAAFP